MQATPTKPTRRGRKLVLAVSAAVLAFTVPLTASGVAADTDQLQQRLDALVATGVPGAVLLVRKGDETVRLTSGYGQLKTKTKVRATDRFRVGSLTKTFVASVVLQLVGEGKLSLDDTVERWLPGGVPNGDRITIRQLLNMKAGLYDYPNDPKIEADFVNGNWAHKWRPTQLVELATSHKPLFAPGKGWSYCNTCYVLAGQIVEKATGNSIGAELKRRIFTPLHLRGTSFDTERRIAGPHVHGYYRFNKQLVDTSLLTPSWAWAAGAIVSTADDIADFYGALYRGKVIEPALLNEMRATVAAYSPTQRYGLGIAKFPTPCGTLWGNGGDILGYNSSAYADKAGARQFVLFLNLDELSFNKRISNALGQVTISAFCG